MCGSLQQPDLGPGYTLTRRSAERNIGATDEPARLRCKFVNVDVLVDLHDVIGADLGDEEVGNQRKEALVEVMPGVILFQIRIHAWKWRGHGQTSYFRATFILPIEAAAGDRPSFQLSVPPGRD
jgi:hypothetical protein